MFKKLVLVLAGLWMSMTLAFAQVDVNKADQAALDGVKGIGPKISKSIVDERTKNGDFKDWADFEKRVKGIGDKNSAKMSAAGLTVNGQPKSGAPAAKTDTKAAAASAKADTKADMKADAKSSSVSADTGAKMDAKARSKEKTKATSTTGSAASPAAAK